MTNPPLSPSHLDRKHMWDPYCLGRDLWASVPLKERVSRLRGHWSYCEIGLQVATSLNFGEALKAFPGIVGVLLEMQKKPLTTSGENEFSSKQLVRTFLGHSGKERERERERETLD